MWEGPETASVGRYPGLAALDLRHPADLHDTQGARRLLAGLTSFVPRLKKIWADAAYRGQELADWCKAHGEWDLEVVERTPGVRGFSVLPKRWIVERTFGWISRNRRMSNDYERKVQTSETLIELAASRLVLRRLARHTYHARPNATYHDLGGLRSTFRRARFRWAVANHTVPCVHLGDQHLDDAHRRATHG